MTKQNQMSDPEMWWNQTDWTSQRMFDTLPRIQREDPIGPQFPEAPTVTDDQMWFERHPYWAGFLFLLAVLLVFGLLGSGGSSNHSPRSQESAVEEPYPDPGYGPQGAGT